MGLRVLLTIAAFAGMIALCVVGWNYGGMGGIIGGALGFLVRLPGRGLDWGERLGNGYVGALMTQQSLRAIRAVSQPHSFNVGLNLGRSAGGSLSEHLHQHVVPRWTGDANFITVVGGAKILPQLLADTRRLLADAWDGAQATA